MLGATGSLAILTGVAMTVGFMCGTAGVSGEYKPAMLTLE